MIEPAKYAPKCAFAAAMLLGMALAASPARANAVVTVVGPCADYFILSSPNGYALIQWMAGRSLTKDDVITDDIASVGRKDAMLATGQRVRFFVEDAGMNQAAATQMMNTRCGVKPPALFHFP